MSASRHGFFLWVVAISIVTCVVVPPSMADAPRLARGIQAPDGPVPGQVLIRLTADAKASASYKADLGSHGRTGLADLDAVLAVIDAVRVQPLLKFPAQAPTLRGQALNRTLLVYYDSNEDPNAAVSRLTAVGDVELAVPDAVVKTTGIPNDPLFPAQWSHRNTGQAESYSGPLVGTPDCDTDTDRAWEITTGSSGITIAIIDTGVDSTHPEFAGRILLGYDFYNDDYDAMDDNGHGTACAGVAAGQGNNLIGVAGVSWQSRILPVKVLNSHGESYSSSPFISGIVWAVDQGADILSISMGLQILNEFLEDAVAYAYGQGRPVFCAAGNNDNPGLVVPAYYTDYTIPIGALSPCGERKSPISCDGEYWWGSNHTTSCIFAPGVRIASTDISGADGNDPGYFVMDFNGTSAATPHAAGIGALVLARNPGLTPGGLENVLLRSSEDLGAPGTDSDTGWGRLNAQLAVLSAFSLPTYCRAGYVGAEFGTLHQPTNTFQEGVDYVATGGLLVMFGGNYDLVSPVSLSEPMTIRGINGIARISP